MDFCRQCWHTTAPIALPINEDPSRPTIGHGKAGRNRARQTEADQRLAGSGRFSLRTGEREAAGGVVSAAPSLTRIWNREAYHATKAALAGLRSRSTRSAGYGNWHDWTARTEHLIPLESKVWRARTPPRAASVGGVFLWATGSAALTIRNTGQPEALPQRSRRYPPNSTGPEPRHTLRPVAGFSLCWGIRRSVGTIAPKRCGLVSLPLASCPQRSLCWALTPPAEKTHPDRFIHRSARVLCFRPTAGSCCPKQHQTSLRFPRAPRFVPSSFRLMSQAPSRRSIVSW